MEKTIFDSDTGWFTVYIGEEKLCGCVLASEERKIAICYAYTESPKIASGSTKMVEVETDEFGHPRLIEIRGDIRIETKDSNVKTGMNLDLDRKDLVALVNGSTPNYPAMELPLIKKNGWFDGTRGEWHWNGLGKVSDAGLVEIRRICKASWEVESK